MPMTKEQLLEEAMALDAQERELLADELLLSLTDVDRKAIDAAWLEECHRRAEAIDRGEMPTIPGDQVMRELHERFRP